MLHKFLDNFNKRIVTVLDEKGFTILHHLVLKQSLPKLLLFFDYLCLVQRESPDTILAYVNTPTAKDKFTALHFASFKGNLKIIDLLIKKGADIREPNFYGLNMLHVAA